MKRSDFASVKAYLAAQPPQARRVLERVRATIQKALPDAAEGISYQIPVYRLDGVMVLYFAGYPRHYAIYPATPHVVSALRQELKGLLHGRATIRFPMRGAVPTRLIASIAKLRAEEALAHALTTAKKKAGSTKTKASSPKRRAKRR